MPYRLTARAGLFRSAPSIDLGSFRFAWYAHLYARVYVWAYPWREVRIEWIED